MIRPPAVAGQFYPGTAAEVDTALRTLIPPTASKRHAKAVICPHAGWTYSGCTAGFIYSQVEIPDRVILVGPNHHGVGSKYAVYASGSWHTPVGDVPIAEPLAADLLDNCELLAEDLRAHGGEHSLEVQAPMLLHANPNVRIVPLLIGGGWPESGGRRDLREIGAAIAQGFLAGTGTIGGDDLQLQLVVTLRQCIGEHLHDFRAVGSGGNPHHGVLGRVIERRPDHGAEYDGTENGHEPSMAQEHPEPVAH